MVYIKNVPWESLDKYLEKRSKDLTSYYEWEILHNAIKPKEAQAAFLAKMEKEIRECLPDIFKDIPVNIIMGVDFNIEKIRISPELAYILQYTGDKADAGNIGQNN